MTADPELDVLLAALPKPSPREMMAELLEARRRAESAPAEASIIPQPEHEFPDGRRWWEPVLAFGCPHRCGWAHREDPHANFTEEAALPLVIPAGSPEEVSRAISAQANARAEAQRARIEGAILEHLQTAHSDQEAVSTLEGSSPSPSPTAGHRAAPPSSPPRAGSRYARGES
ncbi:hypothetical protein [Streptomyces collinus]